MNKSNVHTYTILQYGDLIGHWKVTPLIYHNAITEYSLNDLYERKYSVDTFEQPLSIESTIPLQHPSYVKFTLKLTMNEKLPPPIIEVSSGFCNINMRNSVCDGDKKLPYTRRVGSETQQIIIRDHYMRWNDIS